MAIDLPPWRGDVYVEVEGVGERTLPAAAVLAHAAASILGLEARVEGVTLPAAVLALPPVRPLVWARLEFTVRVRGECSGAQPWAPSSCRVSVEYVDDDAPAIEYHLGDAERYVAAQPALYVHVELADAYAYTVEEWGTPSGPRTRYEGEADVTLILAAAAAAAPLLTRDEGPLAEWIAGRLEEAGYTVARHPK